MPRRGVAVIAVLMAVAGPASAQDSPLLGRWRTAAQDGIVEIQRCGAGLCGRIVDAAPLRRDPNQTDVRNPNPALRTRPLRGLSVLEGFTGGPTTWTGGPLYDPQSGQGAGRGVLTLLEGGRLSVRGCIAPLLCRTQIWTRSP
ncbi:DUF2147 domain-containing protein [Brevundimonas sp. SPF441]|uniref:DUF2147 domain-containing protein n=1 Tax=Brevundimonas sp. SPF441 TaxID=2663795 RepID=UPI00129DEF2F|nr:DUF2147 domain-containing protein [Brevundimonas sp. SPF441]MRL67548.1 DUF2147 domain-containing protein [Brevundimonas sp. SPF441]